MDYYVIETDWDENLNSPWDTLWEDLEEGSLACLDGDRKSTRLNSSH